MKVLKLFIANNTASPLYYNITIQFILQVRKVSTIQNIWTIKNKRYVIIMTYNTSFYNNEYNN